MARSILVIASITTAAGILVSLAAAQDSSKEKFTARELYYAAAQAPSQPSAPNPAPKAAPKPPTPTVASTPPKPVEVATTTQTPPPHPVVQPSTPSTPAQTTQLPGGGRIINASTAPAPDPGPALGLKYTILKDVGGEYVEAAPDAVFHSKDHIRFKVESNSPGYLYIVSLGSTGMWTPMFPASDVDNGSNHIEGFRSYTMPPGSRITFDDNAGDEKVFIVLSREPEPDLEKMIYALKDGTTKTVSAPSEPASTPAAQHQTLMASARIDDNTIGRLRNAYARDLIVEKITDDTPGDRKEKATYVVNPTGSKSSRVVADLILTHK